MAKKKEAKRVTQEERARRSGYGHVKARLKEWVDSDGYDGEHTHSQEASDIAFILYY